MEHELQKPAKENPSPGERWRTARYRAARALKTIAAHGRVGAACCLGNALTAIDGILRQTLDLQEARTQLRTSIAMTKERVCPPLCTAQTMITWEEEIDLLLWRTASDFEMLLQEQSFPALQNKDSIPIIERCVCPGIMSLLVAEKRLLEQEEQINHNMNMRKNSLFPSFLTAHLHLFAT